MTQEGKKQTDDLEAMDVAELQAKYKEVLGQETISRNKEVLIEQIRRGQHSQEIEAKREARKKAGAKSKAQTPTAPQRLEDMTTEQLQRELNALTGHKVVTRDRAVLNRMISKLQKQKAGTAEATPDAAAPTVTKRLVAIANMKLPALRDEYQRVFGKPSLSRNRKALLVKIAEKLQADEAATGSPTAPVAKPTLTVKFERKGGKKAVSKGTKGRTKAKPAPKGKETSTKRQTVRPAGERDPRLPKVGTTIERLYKGKKLLVTITENGFTFNGRPFKSLSALAMAITGSAAINGYLFFQLGKYAKKEKAGK